jgi:hypothetical protein
MVDSLDDEFVKSFLGEEDTNTENTAITNKMTTDSDADFFTDAFLNSDEDNTDISVETITASENVNETVQTQEQLKKQAMLQYPKLFDESGSLTLDTQDKAVALGIINAAPIGVPGSSEEPVELKYLSNKEQQNYIKDKIVVTKNVDMSNLDKFDKRNESVDKQMSTMLSGVDEVLTEEGVNLEDITDEEKWTKLFEIMRGPGFDAAFFEKSKKEQGNIRGSYYMGTILSTLDKVGIGDNMLSGMLSLKRGLDYTGAYLQDNYIGMHNGIDEITDGGFTNLLGMDSQTASRRFVGDIVTAIELAEVLPTVSAVGGGVGTLRNLSKGLTVLPSQRVNKKGLLGAFNKPDTEAMLKDGTLVKETRGKLNPLGLISKERIVTAEKKVRGDFDIVAEQLGRQIALEKGRKFNIPLITQAIDKAKATKSKAADQRASESTEIAEEMIDAFEKEAGVKISRIDDKTGKKVLDYELARVAGEETTRRVAVGETTNFLGRLGKIGDVGYGKRAVTDDGIDIATGTDELVSPILNPEKFNPLIAVVADLKAKNPDLFKSGRKGSNSQNTVIDDLFEITVRKDLIKNEELISLLNKYGLNIEEYILMVVGSGSKAGKALNKLSQMKRIRPKNELKQLEEKAIAEMDAIIGDFAKRTENIRRGGLVSQIATAARNVWSMGIRMPLESIGNVIDTAIYSAQKGIEQKSFAPLMSTSYKHSFDMLKNVYTGVRTTRITTSPTGKDAVTAPNLLDTFKMGSGQGIPGTGRLSDIVTDAFLPRGREVNMKSELEEFVDILLKDPKFAEQAKIMFGTVQEIQQSMGKGVPKNNIVSKGLDEAVDGYEDLIHFMNTPNRMQEFLMRRSVMTAEVQRLLKRDWDLDLIDELENGRYLELINDTARPDGARSFIDIMARAADRAVDITYAKQPETRLFQEANRFITRLRIGPFMIGTILAPFPRFMFNNLELLGQYAAGASAPISRKMTQLVTKTLTLNKYGKGSPDTMKVGEKGKNQKSIQSDKLFRPLSEKDRELISRNMIGWASIYGLYQIVTDEDQPADYKKLMFTDDTVVDTSPFTPLRPGLYLAKGASVFEQGAKDSTATTTAGKILDGIAAVNDWTDAKEFIETFAGVNVQKGIGSGVLQTFMNTLGASDLVTSEKAAKGVGSFFGNLYATWLVPFKQAKDLEIAMGIRTNEIKEYRKDPDLNLDKSLYDAFMAPANQMGFFIDPDAEENLPNKVFPFRPEGVDKRRFPAMKFLGFTVTTANTEDGEFIERLGFSDYKISSKSKVPSIKAIENEVFQEHLGVIVKYLRNKEKELEEEGLTKTEIRTELRSMAKTQMKTYERNLGTTKSLATRLDKDVDKTLYLILSRKFRRLDSDARKTALNKWKRDNPKKEFIGSDKDHIKDVLINAFVSDFKAKTGTGLMKKNSPTKADIEQYLYGPILNLAK